MRIKEHARRAELAHERKRELLALTEAKLAKIHDMDDALMEEEDRLKKQQTRERRKRAEALERKINNQPPAEEVDSDIEVEQGPDQNAVNVSQPEVTFTAEQERLECMLDQTVMSEERRLRSMLDVGTPDNLNDVIRRLRADDPRLIKVTLRQNQISFAEAAALADAIAHNTCVLSIDFRYNKIGDYGCKLIADAIINCPSVGELRIQPNDTGRTGMEALLEAARMCQFQAMSISSATLAMPEQSFSPLMLRTHNQM